MADPVTASPLHTVVEMALRRQRPGTGSSLLFLKERTTMIEWPRLDFLEPLFAVIGAVGMRLYAPERSTRDLDVIVAAPNAGEAEGCLDAAGWQRLGPLSIGGSSWRPPNGQELDLFFGAESWWPEIIGDAHANRDQRGLPIAPLKAQVWLKLRAGRTVDAGDLSRLLGLARAEQIEEVRAFDRVDRRDLQDFESLVQLGRLEFGAPGTNG